MYIDNFNLYYFFEDSNSINIDKYYMSLGIDALGLTMVLLTVILFFFFSFCYW